ncbi:MAG TPA: GGDEF domain-containing protein, partial [Candidatus Dormibacteraeota bacterium]|nr:GGDEF domain-containing protein [Candidatus Dormibacteraeota bacterium]
NDILSTVMRGVVEALHFKRVILFDVLEGGKLIRRLECDASGTVLHAADPREFRQASTMIDLVNRSAELAFGNEGDDERPLDDTHGPYCAVPLIAREIVRGILYADSPPEAEISENQLRMMLDFASQAAVAVENARLHEEMRRLLEESQRLALTDSLTGIPNRRALNEMLERELHTSERYDTPFAYAILDLDDLKKINDTGGHGLGDLALKRFAQVLKKNARKGDIIARYAGDEFVLVMAQSDREHANYGVERMLAAMRRSGLSTSIGVSMFPADGIDGQTLFYAADEALYKAKQHGKNCFVFYERATKDGEEPNEKVLSNLPGGPIVEVDDL